MHPRVKELLHAAAARYGVPAEDILGPNRRSTALATQARWEMIRELYDPSAGPASGTGSKQRFIWSKSRVAREMGVHHTSVMYALSRNFTGRFTNFAAAARDDEIIAALPATTRQVAQALTEQGYEASPAAVRKRLTALRARGRIRYYYDATGTPVWEPRRSISLSGIASPASLTR